MFLHALVFLLGLASWPLWPEAWRLGLALGWGLGMTMEWLVNRARLRLLQENGSHGNLMTVSAFGFLGKLVILAGGGVLGALTDFYHYSAFLLAFVVAVFYGEGVGVASMLRPRAVTSDAKAPND